MTPRNNATDRKSASASTRALQEGDPHGSVSGSRRPLSLFAPARKPTVLGDSATTAVGQSARASAADPGTRHNFGASGTNSSPDADPASLLPRHAGTRGTAWPSGCHRARAVILRVELPWTPIPVSDAALHHLDIGMTGRGSLSGTDLPHLPRGAGRDAAPRHVASSASGSGPNARRLVVRQRGNRPSGRSHRGGAPALHWPPITA